MRVIERYPSLLHVVLQAFLFPKYSCFMANLKRMAVLCKNIALHSEDLEFIMTLMYRCFYTVFISLIDDSKWSKWILIWPIVTQMLAELGKIRTETTNSEKIKPEWHQIYIIAIHICYHSIFHLRVIERCLCGWQRPMALEIVLHLYPSFTIA